jgi:hypothetical protein
MEYGTLDADNLSVDGIQDQTGPTSSPRVEGETSGFW